MNLKAITAAAALAAALAWAALHGPGSRPAVAQPQPPAADPLPSWNPGANKDAILRLVRDVTDEGSPHFVPPDERVAVFDNDGTLWVEQPVYTELVFAADRVRELAPQHPDWKTAEPFKKILGKDLNELRTLDQKDYLELLAASHAGMTTADFDAIVRAWFATARHPRFRKLYPQLAYQPMLEVIAHLQKNGFATFIVSGGGVDFMRGYAPKTYGIGPPDIVGTSIRTEWQLRKTGPVLLRLPQLFFMDNGPGKPIGIERHIGRRPTIAFGNSDGDLEMLQWTAAGKGRRLMLLVHHDDARREYAYDRDSPVGRLDVALDAARRDRWNLISMKDDWKTVFPPAAGE